MNSQLKSEGKELLIIDKTNWLEFMKTVRGAEESPQMRQYVRYIYRPDQGNLVVALNLKKDWNSTMAAALLFDLV